MNYKKILLLIALLGMQPVLAGCATAPADPEERAAFEEANDPIEPVNRAVFGFNQYVDNIVIRPVTQIYIALLPEYARERVSSVLNNLGEPVNFVNNALQGRGNDAADTVARFVVNSTVGVGGMFDVAADMDVPERPADFGQTLFVYGVGEGPYLVLPLLGPSNPRDTTGLVADYLIDPWGYVVDNNFNDNDALAINGTRVGLTIVDARSKTLTLTDKLERDSFDYYATMRSIARQYRQKQLQGKGGVVPSSYSSTTN